MTEIAELISYFNQTKGIPLVVTTVTQSNWTQFYINIFIALLGSVFLLYYVWTITFKGSLAEIIIKLKLKQLKNKTGRHMLIIKHTQSDLFSQSMISQETIRDVLKALTKFKGKPFDLILYTPGGDVFAAQYISRILRNYGKKIRAIIPIYSMSGGTFLALSCDEIYMAPTACLGPVDPQLGNLFKYGSSKAWSKIVKYKGRKAEDSSISFAMMGEQYTRTIRNNIIELLSDKIPGSEAKKLATFLTNGEVEHAFSLTPQLLRANGLNIKDLDNKTTLLLTKVLSSSLFEGVYHI